MGSKAETFRTKKSANGFILGDHEHEKSELINMTKNWEKSQVLSEVNDVFNVKLLEYNNFEAGEGKTALDTHFSHISHKIGRYVRLGNDLETGEELGELVQVIDCFNV